ncbi:hypothetical protein MRX96_049017 [Rhipicephalus microplus]
MMQDGTAASLVLARAIASNSHLVLETLRWGVVMRSETSMATEGCKKRSFAPQKARRSCTLLHAAWIDEDLMQGDTSDDAAVKGASDQQLLRALDATLWGQEDSKMPDQRDDAPTKGRVSIVLRALSEPDLLAPKEVDGLVRAVLWKAIHDDDIAEPAAKFCTRVIKDEFDGGFIDRLLWTCRNWFKHFVISLPRSTYWAPVEPKTQKNTGQKLIAIVNFMAVLLSDVPENPGAASMGSLHCGHIFSWRRFCVTPAGLS